MSTTPGVATDLAAELRSLAEGTHRDPHRVLGLHPQGNVTVVRAFHPDAVSVAVAFGANLSAYVGSVSLWSKLVSLPCTIACCSTWARSFCMAASTERSHSASVQP